MSCNKKKFHLFYKAALCFTGFAFFMSGCGKSAEEEWEPEVRQEEVVLDGLTGEYDFLFLTDSHVVVKDKKAPEQEAAYDQERFAMFRNDAGVSSAKQLQEMFAYANREAVDAVLLGGDIIDSPSDADLKYLDQELESLQMPYLYTLGNHDWTFPWEYMSETGRQAYLPLFAPYMGGNTAVHMWETGELRFIAVDNSSNQVNPEALELYEKLLDTDKRVVLLLHVPFSSPTLSVGARELWSSPVAVGYGEGEIYPNDATRRLTDLTLAADSPVELILAGHVHFYDRSYIEWEKSVLQITGGAACRGGVMRLHITGGK